MDELTQPFNSDSVNLFDVFEHIYTYQRSTEHKEADVAWHSFLSAFQNSRTSANHERSEFSDHLTEAEAAAIFNFILMPYFDGRVSLEETVQYLKLVESREAVDMIVRLWLANVVKPSETSLTLLRRLLRAVSAETGTEALSELQPLLIDSTNLSAALTACLVLAYVALGDEEHEHLGSSENEDWVPVSRERIEWQRLFERIRDVFYLRMFCEKFRDPGAEGEGPPLSVRAFLQRGKGAVCEYVALWNANDIIDVTIDSLLSGLYTNDVNVPMGSREVGETRDRPGKVLRTEALIHAQPALIKDLQSLRARFPRTLTADLLLANCCFEMGARWNLDVQNVRYLKMSLSFLRCIVNPYLIHGRSK